MLISTEKIIGLPVVTTSGEKIGSVKELEIEIDSQSILNYIVVPEGLVKTLLHQSLVVHRGSVRSITQEKIIVDDGVEQQVEDKKQNATQRVSTGVVRSEMEPK